MFSVITNIYNKKTEGPTLMDLFKATGRLKKFFLMRDFRCVHIVTRVWQELEYRIDVCCVTRCAHIENLSLKKTFSVFLWL